MALPEMVEKSSGKTLTEEDALELGRCTLANAEKFMIGTYSTANNEVALIYDKLSERAILAKASPEDKKTVDLIQVFEKFREQNLDLSGLTITHNHPGGNPLSDKDVSSTVRNNVKEIRAAGKYGVFSLKRPEKGWPQLGEFDKLNKDTSYDHLALWNTARSQAEVDLGFEKRGINPESLEKGMTDRDELLNHLYQWKTLENYASATGATFGLDESQPEVRRETKKSRFDTLMEHLAVQYPVQDLTQVQQPAQSTVPQKPKPVFQRRSSLDDLKKKKTTGSRSIFD